MSAQQTNSLLRTSLSMEAHQLIVQYIGNRADLCSLSRVSRDFQTAAERALYNTIYFSRTQLTTTMCEVLATQPRLAAYVVALTIYSTDDEEEGESLPLPDGYWNSIARALRATARLLHLSIHLEDSSGNGHAWILDDCQFKLHTFHCELTWDSHLLGFLTKQPQLTGLCVLDFPYHSAPLEGPSAVIAPRCAHVRLPRNPRLLPALSILECPTVDAVALLVPQKPISRVKTSLSTLLSEQKRGELDRLFSNLRLSISYLISLDLGDTTFDSRTSLEILRNCAAAPRTRSELRYLGTLSLPVDGRQRLQFYGLLMKLPQLKCIAVEVSDWHPAPMTFAALRALTNELRLYSRSVTRVVFVHNHDGVVVSATEDGFGGCILEDDWQTDDIWREI